MNNQQQFYYPSQYPQYYMPNNGAMPDMLNGYKQQYQQPIQQQPIPQPPQAKAPTNDMIWVQGEAGAKGYLVAPNNTVVLWDTENPTIYVKSADGSGIPSLRILDFTERTTQGTTTPDKHVCKCGDNFVSKKDFNALQAKIDELQAKYDTLAEKSKAKTIKKAEEE